MNDTHSTTQKTTGTQIKEKALIKNGALRKDKALSRRKIAFSKFKRRALRHLWLVRATLIGLVLAAFVFLVVVFGLLFKDSAIGRYIKLSRNFLFTPTNEIKSSYGRTNILILGKGGAGHEAPDLTDTIIFASVDDESNINLISIPRDIWIPSIRAKVNSSYFWGNQKEYGGGLVLAKANVEEVVGQPVHYVVVIDFEAFGRVIDVVNGIEVDVENGFVDEKYPIEGREDDECNGDIEFMCRYETITFTKGKQLMDGETALKFVRSRNAEGDEGTDFARNARQQKVIDALKSKLLSRGVVLSPRKLLRIKEILENYVETDIGSNEAAILARYALGSRDRVSSEVIPEDLLVNPEISPRYDELYVFIPKGDDPETPENEWDVVHEWVESVLRGY